MFKITLRPRSPLALHCLDMAPKDRNAELIRLADLGLAVERLGIGGSKSGYNDLNGVHKTENTDNFSIAKPSLASPREEQRGIINTNVDFGDDLFQLGT